MPVGKGKKQAKPGASKGKSAASKKTARSSKTEEKKAGTRIGTLIYVRSAGKKKGGAAKSSRNKLRDGS
jgi:hypothetical protein